MSSQFLPYVTDRKSKASPEFLILSERDSASWIADPTISELRVKGSCPRGVSLWEPSLKSSNEADSEISRLSFGFQYSEPLYEDDLENLVMY